MIDDDDMRWQFIDDMNGFEPSIGDDYLEALVFALDAVAPVRRGNKHHIEMRYFGVIGDGVFYADGQPENARWYTMTKPSEAIGLLSAEFGEDFVQGLPIFLG